MSTDDWQIQHQPYKIYVDPSQIVKQQILSQKDTESQIQN